MKDIIVSEHFHEKWLVAAYRVEGCCSIFFPREYIEDSFILLIDHQQFSLSYMKGGGNSAVKG